MSVSNRLVFDPTDATSIAASSSIGSYIRAGDDGTLIGHVSDALKVSFTNGSFPISATDLDIRDLVFATDKVDVTGSSVGISGTVAVTQSTSPWVVSATDLDIRNLAFATDTVDVSGSSVSITGSVAVTATDLDIRDLTAASDSVESWTHDGTGNAITSTASALDVNIKSGDLDDNLANVSIENESRTVGVTAIATTAAAALVGRKWLYLANVSNKSIYFGKASVTTANGFPVYPGDKHEFRIGAAVTTNVIGDAAALDLRVMQLS
jgi:hypothetical protein